MVAAKLIEFGAEGRQRIDRYELVAEIATGGMATVFLARLSGMGGFQRFVAIKRLHPHLAKENEFVEMFLDEARLAAGIHHPNVVPILEVGASEHGYYLIMEYIEGDTLARLLARAATSSQKLPVKIGARIAVDMLHGLHAAHELRDENDEPTELVHRDVSPQNILVGVDGSSRITDFGVARAASRLSATRVGQLKGKLAYMAPEQAAGEDNVDRRADIFSAGIVIWEVLAARRLFKAETEAATLSRVMNEKIIPPSEMADDVDAEISRVCMKALHREPEERYATCEEFAQELEAAAVAAEAFAPGREVAKYVTDVIGNEIGQQREAVRAWLARSEPSQALANPGVPDGRISQPSPNVSSVSAGAMSVPGPELSIASAPAPSVHSRARGPLIAVALLLFAALSLGVVLLFIGWGSDPVPPPEGPRVATEPDPVVEEPEEPVQEVKDGDDAGALSPEDLEREERKKPEPRIRRTGRNAPRPTPRVEPAPPAVAPPAPKPAPKGDEPDLSNPYR